MILVTGGAGYIGSHALLALRERQRDVLVLDDLSEGHRGALRGAPLVEASMLDAAAVEQVFATHRIDAVMHFAARCYVGESVREPGLYYRANVLGTLHLLEAMVRHGCKRFVFSSTCATYGEPERQPITEEAAQAPVNPYGETKLVCERMLRDFAHAHGIDVVALRYFNAAGADPGGRIGEDHAPETHLLPLVLGTLLGQRPVITVFGADYPTRDGTCIRDYVHVTDLAEAHVLALLAMERGELRGMHAFNLGNELGTSVLEVIASAERVTGKPVPTAIGPRRPGDPPVLVGSSAKIKRVLGWQPRHAAIDQIVATAWAWHRAHPAGFGEGHRV